MDNIEEITEVTDKIKYIKLKYYLLSKNLKWLEEPLEEYLDELEDNGKLTVMYINSEGTYNRLECDTYKLECKEYYDIYAFNFRGKFSKDYKRFQEDTYGKEWVVLK